MEDGRYVPPGVEADSWIGFERRIQERRFRALVETVRSAIASGRGLEARVALDEARELRPAAPELDGLDAEVARLPMAAAVPPRKRVPARAAGAALMLIAGIGLLVGSERWHRAGVAPAEAVAPARAAEAIDRPASDSFPSPVAASPAVTSLLEPIEETAGTSGTLDSPSERAAGSVRPAVDPIVGVPAIGSPPAPTPVATTPGADPFVPAPLETAGGASAAPAPDPSSALPGARVGQTPLAPSPPAVEPEAGAASIVRSGASPASGDPPFIMGGDDSRAAPVAGPRDERARVAQVLEQYASRYSQLDAAGLRAVWPTAPALAIARAFAQLESQIIAFSACDIDVEGVTARASCRGSQRFVTRIGSREPRTEERRWEFVLRRSGDRWTIEDAQVR